MRTTSTVIVLICFAASTWAQLTVNINPGSINYGEGQVYLDGKPLQFNPRKMQEIKKWQDLRTGAGRVEIQLGLAATMWLGEQGRLRMDEANPANVQLFVDQGPVYVEVIEKFEYLRMAIHFGDAVVELKDIGFYRFDSNPPRLSVYAGLAEILQKYRKTRVKPGKSADLADGWKVSGFNKKQNDPMYVWVGARSDLLYGRIKQERNADRISETQQLDWMQDRVRLDAERQLRIYQAIYNAGQPNQQPQ